MVDKGWGGSNRQTSGCRLPTVINQAFAINKYLLPSSDAISLYSKENFLVIKWCIFCNQVMSGATQQKSKICLTVVINWFTSYPSQMCWDQLSKLSATIVAKNLHWELDWLFRFRNKSTDAKKALQCDCQKAIDASDLSWNDDTGGRPQIEKSISAPITINASWTLWRKINQSRLMSQSQMQKSMSTSIKIDAS